MKNARVQVLEAMLARNVEVEERLMDAVMSDLVKGGRWEEGGRFVCMSVCR